LAVEGISPRERTAACAKSARDTELGQGEIFSPFVARSIGVVECYSLVVFVAGCKA
jgi:hypothetical protein